MIPYKNGLLHKESPVLPLHRSLTKRARRALSDSAGPLRASGDGLSAPHPETSPPPHGLPESGGVANAARVAPWRRGEAAPPLGAPHGRTSRGYR